MKIKEIYEVAIQKGLETDFRSKEEIERYLERVKDKYKKLPENKKELFDKERLSHPYTDTRILFGDPEKEVKKVLVGIDIDGDELFIAERIGVDLVIAHHPRGIALAGLDEVMDLQVELLAKYGVPIHIAERLLRKRITEVARGLSPGNHNRVVDLAQLLNIPLMCVHTPSDNLVARFLEQKILKENQPYWVKDIFEILYQIPEYRIAERLGIGPKLFAGSMENRAGRIALTEITGGTEGSPEIYQKLSDVGIGTIIGMHMSEKHREEAEKSLLNVVIAGHMSSDSLGMNLFLDELEKREIEIIPCSGFIRISRV